MTWETLIIPLASAALGWAARHWEIIAPPSAKTPAANPVVVSPAPAVPAHPVLADLKTLAAEIAAAVVAAMNQQQQQKGN